MGRPSLFSAQIVAAIADRVANGEPLSSVCRDPGMPGLSTIYDWRERDENFRQLLEDAQQCGLEALADEQQRLARETNMVEVVREWTVKGDLGKSHFRETIWRDDVRGSAQLIWALGKRRDGYQNHPRRGGKC